MIVFMTECVGCGNCFKPGDNDQAVCDSCRDEDSDLAERIRMAAECEPFRLEEEEFLNEELTGQWSPRLSYDEDAWFSQAPEEYSF